MQPKFGADLTKTVSKKRALNWNRRKLSTAKQFSQIAHLILLGSEWRAVVKCCDRFGNDILKGTTHRTYVSVQLGKSAHAAYISQNVATQNHLKSSDKIGNAFIHFRISSPTTVHLAQGQILLDWLGMYIYYQLNERVDEIVNILHMQRGIPPFPSCNFRCGRTISSATTPLPMFRLHMLQRAIKLMHLNGFFSGYSAALAILLEMAFQQL